MMLHPVLLIVGMVACVLASIALSLIALDNWERGNQRFSLISLALAGLAIFVADATVTQIEHAYAERLEDAR